MGARQENSPDRSSQRLVVIGGSAGAVPALLELANALPEDFPAPICVVIHIGTNRSILPALLNHRGPGRALHARDGDALEAGKIYVAPPDRHLLVIDGAVRLTHGPKENHTRPAIDPLFRTAAVQWRERAIGVILSGQLDDGVAGLKAIKECGGFALVQEPDSALHPEMPLNALAAMPVDGRLEPRVLALELARLMSHQPASAVAQPVSDTVLLEAAIHLGKDTMEQLPAIADPSTLTCPDCGGTLWHVRDSMPERYRCHTGHAFTSLALESAQAETAEGALWAAVRALREREMLLRRLAALARTTGDEKQAAAGETKADMVHAQVSALRRMLEAESPREAVDAVKASA